MKKVGIIGGSGFIGSYITKIFLEENFKVKVSATDISKKEKYKHLRKLSHAENLEISPLNVEDINAIQEFIEGCEILIHCGTPFKLDVEDVQKELFDPTVKGTNNFLQVISESSSLNKVVFVASVAAYNTAFPFPVEGKSTDHLYTEEDVPSLDTNGSPYAQAKYHADQAVRKFIEDHPDIGFEIVSVSPVAVMGKPLSNREDSTSVGLQHLFKNKLAPNSFLEMLYEQDVEFAMVDVNDVAESIFRAAVLKGNHGKNYLISSDSWKVSDIVLMLNNKRPKGKSHMVYSNKLATEELGVVFKPSQVPLHQFS